MPTQEATKKPDDQRWGRGQRPVINVTWHEADKFCKSYGYRLPTEAEWEYAARAGSKTRWSFGDDASRLGDYAWYDSRWEDGTQPVGEKLPNPWGLYDMSGNVWEWVEDCYAGSYKDAPTDGSAKISEDCPTRVLRGGSFYDPAEVLRSANRFRNWPVAGLRDFGFRCVRAPRRWH